MLHAILAYSINIGAKRETRPTGVENTSSQIGNMHTNSPSETGVRRYRIIEGSYKIGKRAKEKRAEVEARQREMRRSGSAPKRNAPN